MFEGFANVWTPVLPAKELRDKPLRVELAGEKLAVFRDGSGRIGALLDRCPHRGVALSLGRVDENGCLTCPFHGWAFQTDGACAHVPLNDVPADKRARYAATSVPAREAGGLLWIFTGEDAKGEAPPVPSSLLDPGWHTGFQSAVWKAHWTRAMENMLDTPHLPFVHGNSIGRDLKKKLRRDTRLAMRIEPRPYGGEIFSQWNDDKEETILKWLRPNGMELTIMDEPKRKLRLHAYCVPLDKDRTRMIVTSSRTFFGSKLVTWLGTRFNNVLGEDQAVLESSDPPEVPPPGDEVSVATDAPTLYFRKYYYRELRGSSASLVPPDKLARRPEAAQEPAEAPAVGDAALVH